MNRILGTSMFKRSLLGGDCRFGSRSRRRAFFPPDVFLEADVELRQIAAKCPIAFPVVSESDLQEGV
jgi:hypothetical protein